MKNKLMSATLYLLMSGALAAPAPPVPAVYPSENDGFVYANIDRGNKAPEFKFCPNGYHIAEIDDYKGMVGCGPEGKGSAWDGHFKSSQIVPSINGQQYLDQKFGQGVVKFLGVAPTGNGSYNAVIFYRIIKK